MVGGRRIKCILFADDVALLAEEEIILKNILLELNDSCEQYEIKINANKTKSMVIGRKIQKINLRILNEAVQQVDSFKYLGKNDTATDQEEEKEFVVSLGEKKLPTEGFSGRNGEREKSSGQNKISDDIHWNASPFLLQHGTQLATGSWPHVLVDTTQWHADSNVHRSDWPAQSPDLIPSEHLWDKLDCRLRSREMRPTSIVQLSAMLREEWRRIPVDILYKLVESMPDRVATVIATRGGTTRF
ncbi:hypothetical protein ANN_21195 [Periplaneta americana]|uniref:Reverse transcriptase domain-containing protein n=1 Tax=Periplaneta americana TaxID=6978 RepID=A0ABQ8SFU9_PERAM|nr:hypothetical protein ANN_21195 [Periplaneta americana]